jgi:hypothetical protein
METLAAHWHDPLVIAGHAYAADEAVKALGRQLDRLLAETHETRNVPLGTFHGLTFGVVLHRLAAPEAYLEGEMTRHALLSRDAGPRALLNALDRLAEGYSGQLSTARQDLAIAENQLRDYESRLGQPFAHSAYLEELTALRDQLRAGLSGAAPEPGTVPSPPAAETAERITALKAAHAALPAPERRVLRGTATAETPVTARIRRRPATPPEPLASEVAPDAAIATPEPPLAVAADADTGVTQPPASPAVITLPRPAPRPASAFRERVIHGRRQHQRQLSLF